jgi:hypothetical protein
MDPDARRSLRLWQLVITELEPINFHADLVPGTYERKLHSLADAENYLRIHFCNGNRLQVFDSSLVERIINNSGATSSATW